MKNTRLISLFFGLALILCPSTVRANHLPLLLFPNATDFGGPVFVEPSAVLTVVSESGGIGQTGLFFSNLPDGSFAGDRVTGLLGNFQAFDPEGNEVPFGIFDIAGVEVTERGSTFTPAFGRFDFADRSSRTFRDFIIPDNVATLSAGNFNLAFTFTSHPELEYSYSLFVIGLRVGSFLLYNDIEPAINKDYGDAPDSYGTLRASDGPRYAEGDFQRLGFLWDAEHDGQPTPLADGDDRSILGGIPRPLDDEDGVIFGDNFVVVTTTIIRQGPNSYNLSAWWDLNQNMVFDHPTERFINDTFPWDPQPMGPDPITRTMRYGPFAFDPRAYYSRFRLTWDPATDVTPTGEVFSRLDQGDDRISHGEVEDYVPEPSTVTLLCVGALGMIVYCWKRRRHHQEARH